MSSRDAAILAMFKAGRTQEQIGEKYDISRQRVQQILKRMGIGAADGGAASAARSRRELLSERIAMKTVRVRIAVAVDPSGDWSASGWKTSNGPAGKEAMDIALDSVGEGEARYWVEAELPLPSAAQDVEADAVRVAE